MTGQLTTQVFPQILAQAQESTSFSLDTEAIRTFFHLLGITVWIGGQIVMGFLMPLLRKIGMQVPKDAAQRFNRIAWPFFGLTVFTGIWALGEADWSDNTTGWRVAFFVKMVIVVATGFAAYMHTKATKTRHRVFYAVATLVTALAAMLFGLGLQG